MMLADNLGMWYTPVSVRCAPPLHANSTAAPFDVDDRSVPEADSAGDPRVELREDAPFINHMVGGSRIEDPLAVTALLLSAQVSKDFSLDEVHKIALLQQLQCSRCCWTVWWIGKIYHRTIQGVGGYGCPGKQ